MMDVQRIAGLKLAPNTSVPWGTAIALTRSNVIVMNYLQLWALKMKEATFPKMPARDPFVVRWLMLWAERPENT